MTLQEVNNIIKLYNEQKRYLVIEVNDVRVNVYFHGNDNYMQVLDDYDIQVVSKPFSPIAYIKYWREYEVKENDDFRIIINRNIRKNEEERA